VTVEAAGGIVVDESGRVAIVHRPRYDDWSLPKGHLETGETAEDAALREVFEETGLSCRIIGSAGETQYRDRKGRPKRVRYFSMSITAGSFLVNDEVDELRWIDESGIDELSYAFDAELVRSEFLERSTRGGDQRDE
jgi:8-oxo-dGTP pyrophosphatase MutT (NUDIX family)